MLRGLLFVSLACLVLGAKKEHPDDCEVCRSVITAIDATLTPEDRKDNVKIENKMQAYCDGAKGQDKKMCYYMGVGDKESGTSGGAKREISSSMGRGINSKRLCNRMKTKDAQMCELKYEKKIDLKTVDFKKLRVKELRKICDDDGIDTKGLMEKDDFIKAIKTKHGIKDEV